MNTHFGLLLRSTALAGAIGAIGVTSVSAQDTTVRMWFNGTPEAHGAVLAELIPAFEEANPGITVDYEITSWSAYQQQIATAAAGGTLPDIIFGFSNLVAGFAERGLLADHSEFFDPDDFVPATVELTTWNGTWSMLPTWFSANGLSWRSDLIEAGGNDASAAPQDWDEWLAWAEGATVRGADGGISQLGFYSSSFPFNRSNMFTRMVEGNGGAMFSDDGMTATMNSPEAVEAAAFLQQLVECCDVPRSIEADNVGLGQGRTAMVYNNFAFRNWQNEFPDVLEYAGLGLVPPGPQGTPDMAGAGLGANVIGITSTSQNKEAAAALLQFLIVEPDNIVQLAGLGGSIPGALLPEGHPYFEENQLAARYLELALEGGSPDPAHPNFSEYESIINVWLDELMLNGMDPQKAMDNAAREIQSEIIDRSGIGFN
ncbi:carbohydrate ABC transporter substrate-binding protein (CUT1 family) [Roseinatronobacter monicus]|uniref:Carbohydrate ABC transporter substrate-binding protein (CUT1 family) n=1 Tax=Roseinatronobacter monicus TaxID=393481 RepID=A0A543K5W0_9RHOB|nr:carbohydrate ABC transporter substrate-binding protein (CUT1 family) [Roseinatronobacter monicus]